MKIFKRLGRLITFLLCAACNSAYANDIIDLGKNVSFEVEAKLSNQEISQMASQLCSTLHNTRVSKTSADLGENLEAVLVKFSKISDDDIYLDEKISTFWNAYSENMICRSSGGTYVSQHFFKRAIRLNLHKAALLDYFLEDASKFPINVNALEVYPDGTKATVLDFLNNILASPSLSAGYNVGQLRRLKHVLVRKYDAKTASDLSKN